MDDEAVLNLHLDLEEEKEEENMYQEMLQAEAQRMSARGYQPRVTEFYDT